MNTSSCTEKAPSYEQRPAADDFFQARSQYLFDNNEQSSNIEVYGQLPVDQEIPSKANCFNEDRKTKWQVDTDPSTVLPPPSDQISCSDGDVPLYNGKPTRGWQKIGDGELLKAVAEV